MSNYINEAFKAYRLLESEDFEMTPEGLDTLGSFMNQAVEDEAIDVIDLEAEADEELKKSYVGKVICDCNVCHSNIFYDKEDIVIDEDGIVNIEDECPYCMSMDGYTIVGEIQPYTETEETDVEIDNEETPDLDVELSDEEAEEPIELDSEEDEELEESLQLSGTEELKGISDLRHVDDLEGDEDLRGKNNTELSGDLDLHEAIENISLDTEDETMTMTTKEDGGVVIETSPRDDVDSDAMIDDLDMSDDLSMGDEVVAPLSDETEEELGLAEEPDEEMFVDEEPAFDEEPFGDVEIPEGEETPADEEEVEIDEFDEENFDGLGESYLRRCYNNVKGFKTTQVRCNENLLTVIGNITFKSGNTKRTSFVFESTDCKNGKYIFEGYNKEINKGKKAFKLNCSINNKKIIPESMTYNYRSKNELNESIQVKGKVKVRTRK